MTMHPDIAAVVEAIEASGLIPMSHLVPVGVRGR